MSETCSRVDSIADTRLTTWFERDRAHVALLGPDDDVLVEWWDEAVWEAVEDGFLDGRRTFILGRLVNTSALHQSAYDYWQSIQEG